MKRVIALMLCLLIILPMTACGPRSTGGKTTLMIYMIGSDLEAKGGAGTNDMQEMIGSSVDLSSNTVLVYAGGTKKWHNDHVTADDGHSILKLTEDGFEQVKTRKDESMGDASTLSYFLKFAYDQYKSDNYALVLWDHGNGPLIGYGKDMLHEDDSLTLIEMREALQKSPFSKSNKLAWVGFDACLMSSVELACIWEDYADYLIASQEIEPSFGWNYSFLEKLGKLSAQKIADHIAEKYMTTCLEYYEDRGYAQRDTTLACMDLSALGELRTAVESLFTEAAKNVKDQYNQLVTSRVNTRALGRATTGSEYDLIDLADMANQLSGQYPNQAAAVKSAVQKIVVNNTTNTDGCCGLSIYYPFYNKSYYEKAWADVYRHLNVLPAYTAYLESYAKNWLGKDIFQSVASSTLPQAVSQNDYVLQLTNEQAKNYVDAKYYILSRQGDEIYTRIFTSSNVTKSGNKLTASFDGNVLYAKDKFDTYLLPAVDEHDTVGDYTRYSTYVNLTNSTLDLTYRPEGYEHKVEGHRYHISINNKTKEIKTSALVPYSLDVSTETLMGGKQEDADLSKWSKVIFLNERHQYLKRDKNGTILPLKDWDKTSYLSGTACPINDDISFVFAPIPDGEYYVMFEIEDVQGNSYCSELMPIESSGAEFEFTYQDELAEVEWTSGKKVKLFSQSGVTVSLTTKTEFDATRYAFEVANSNKFDVTFLAEELMYNDSVYCPDGSAGLFTIPAGKTVVDDIGFDFGAAEDLGMLTDLKTLNMLVKVQTATGDTTLVHDKEIRVVLNDYSAGLRKDPDKDSVFSSAYYDISGTARGLKAEEQLLFDHNGLKATLLSLGGDGTKKSKLIATLRIENTADESRHFKIDGVSFDKVFLSKSTGPKTILPGSTVYCTYVLSADELDLHQIASAASVTFYVSHMKFATLQGGGGFNTLKKYSVKLSKKGKAASINTGKSLIYEDEYIKIYLKQKQKREYGGYSWTCVMVNKSNKDIMLGTDSAKVNKKAVDLDKFGSKLLAPYDVSCGAGQSTAFEVVYTDKVIFSLKLSIVPQILDFSGEKVLLEGKKAYELKK